MGETPQNISTEQVLSKILSALERDRNPESVHTSSEFNGEIHTFITLKDKLHKLYHRGLNPGVTTGWKTLDPFYRPRKGEWTIITGYPGHGKTTWLDALMVNLYTQHKWKFAIFSAENQPVERHAASILSKLMQQPFNDGATRRMPEECIDDVGNHANENFFSLS